MGIGELSEENWFDSKELVSKERIPIEMSCEMSHRIRFKKA